MTTKPTIKYIIRVKGKNGGYYRKIEGTPKGYGKPSKPLWGVFTEDKKEYVWPDKNEILRSKKKKILKNYTTRHIQDKELLHTLKYIQIMIGDTEKIIPMGLMFART